MLWSDIRRIERLWKEYGFEAILLGSIVILVILAIFRWGQKGSWSTYKFEPKTYKKKRRAPRQSKGEVECRRVLESIFKRPFPSIRPDFLKNPVTGLSHNLELDCFCQDLSLAVEYSGIQHYKYVPYFHKNKESFLNQKYRDDMKRRICKEHGINLIEVPYTVKNEEIESFLITKLRELKYINY